MYPSSGAIREDTAGYTAPTRCAADLQSTATTTKGGIARSALVGEVVMKQEITPFLRAAQEKGCRTQVGTDMLYEQIPAYLEFFGFPTTTPEELRAVSKVAY